MRETITFSLREVSAHNGEDMRKLNELLQYLGAKADIQHLGDGYHILYIDYDTDKVEKKVTRGAGRKRKGTSHTITVGEVKAMAADQGVDATLEFLGVSRSAYYRRLADAAKIPNGDEFFF